MSNTITVPPIQVATEEDALKAQAAWDGLQQWRESQATSKPLSYERGMECLSQLYDAAKLPTMAPILPQLLSIKGEPFTLKDHFPFEPLYNLVIPPQLLLKTGRQTSKSTNLAALGIIQTAVLPWFNTIYVTPLFEQIRRFSSNYVRTLLTESPIRSALIGEATQGAQNVLQRTFANNSIMFFTFCFTDAERVRGISADCLKIDEVQDINDSFLPVLQHCIAASRFRGGCQTFSGTPKTNENLIEKLWSQSSQAEWVIKCDCGYWNTCTIKADLDKMIQRHGLCCAKCGRLVNSRTGHFRHMNLDKDAPLEFPGYHVPQPILPMHYETWNDRYGPRPWAKIWAQKIGPEQAKYYNECLGESCDVASKLVNKSDLVAASVLPWKNTVKEALAEVAKGQFSHVTMGVDWGGGAGGLVRRVRGVLVVEGGSASFTVVTLVGWRPGNPSPFLLYAERLPTSISPHEEIRRILYLFNIFRCYRIGHDFGGSGDFREILMLQAGFPTPLIFPCRYVPTMHGNMVHRQEAVGQHTRGCYNVDKARSLQMLCQLIKIKGAFLPEWESIRDIAEDFLALVEDKRDRPSGADLFLINRDPSKSDDFCHSFNFACISHWYSQQHYPDMADLFRLTLSDSEVMSMYPGRAELEEGWNNPAPD